MSSSSWREENDEDLGLMGTSTAASARTVYYKKRSIFLCGVSSLLALAVITLSGLLIAISSRSHVATGEHHQSPQWLPPKRHANVTFWPDDIFGERPDTESDKAWDTLFPEGGGYVWFNGTQVQSPEGSERRAVLSVFHQLHCLEMIRIGYFAVLDGDPEAVDQGPGHLAHCWDYLHQGIMCHGDTTLEWVREGDPGSSGWGYEHQCTDFEAIFSWVQAHQHPG
ncbi:hypothetical protein F5Y08DRAFT_338192 [Xylaria arbuscula]|nr:hypothetical protein F5Y08DRAFT_338192 [Xylaria arbuscula]